MNRNTYIIGAIVVLVILWYIFQTRTLHTKTYM